MGKYNISSGVIASAKKVVIYGPEGIGKTKFASQFPGVAFIDTEGSTKGYDVSRFPDPTSWSMLLDIIKDSIGSGIKTLVIDTADWSERMAIDHILASNHKNGIEEFGYGSGYRYIYEEMGRFLNLLTDVYNSGINVVITAHAALRKFEQPDEMGAYDRWELKLTKTPKCDVSAMLKEWADMVLFANYKTYSIAVDKDGKKNKAQGGKRVMYTQHHPCWDAKNRYGLSEECDFSYEVIRGIIEGNAPKEEAPRAITSPPQKAPETPKPTPTPAPVEKEQPKEKPAPQPMSEASANAIDPKIPKALRDLMAKNSVDEWDIQNVVTARGYFPADMKVSDYPEDFIMGVLVGAWQQVYGMIVEMKEKQEVPFN